MTVFEAIVLVDKRLESLRLTLGGFHQRNISSTVPEKDIIFLIEQNELMLIALRRIFEGHPLKYKYREPPEQAIPIFKLKNMIEIG